MEAEEEKPELKWGETPWDNLSKEELLREVQRMYSALYTCQTVLSMVRSGEEHSPFWGTRGTGGAAMEKARQILEPLLKQWESENIYRAFFRYADDLLFEQNEFRGRVGSGWCVCPVCGRAYGRGYSVEGEGPSNAGRCCNDILPLGCPGILEPLRWDHMKKEEKEEGK